MTQLRIPGDGSVVASYRHVPKLATPGPGLPLPGAYVKWYEISRPDAPIQPDASQRAREFLREQVSSGALELRDELGFAMLHLSGTSIHLLLVCTWRGENEIWESVYLADGDGAYQLAPQGTHRGTYCVWELGVVWHERNAWQRYLLSPRDQADRQAYVEDLFSGEV